MSIYLPGCCEDLSGVGADGINGAIVTSDLSYGCEIFHVPHFEHAAPTGAQQHGPTRYVGQSAHPVLVSVGDLLEKKQKEKHIRRRRRKELTRPSIHKKIIQPHVCVIWVAALFK